MNAPQFGRGDRTRTCDTRAPSSVLYQTELHPDVDTHHTCRGHLHFLRLPLIGRGDRIRTCDLIVPNDALYQTELHPELSHVLNREINLSFLDLKLVKMTGFEPATNRFRTGHSTKLSYILTMGKPETCCEPSKQNGRLLRGARFRDTGWGLVRSYPFAPHARTCSCLAARANYSAEGATKRT